MLTVYTPCSQVPLAPDPSAPASSRPWTGQKGEKRYDVVVFGATGFTGKLCAE